MAYQPRYLSYCRAHGMNPDEMHRTDRKRYPGGCMGGFIRWINDRWAEYDREHGTSPSVRSYKVHEDFDRWLESKYPNKEEHKCCSCGKVGDDVTYGSDPYAEEVNGDDTPVWECEECRYQSRLDI